ncbi:MAG: hypothetical protein ACPGYV_00935 [Phycisphaeraceae bacterium]
MISSTNNPPKQRVDQAVDNDSAAQPSKALRTTRVVLAIGLFVGVAVFGVLTIQTLGDGPPTTALPTDFGANPQSAASMTPVPPSTPTASGNPLAGLTGTDATQFVPIVRANPHPGRIVPFLNADAFGQPPYRQPFENREVWELCAYRVMDASPAQAFAYYDARASELGMSRLRRSATSAKRPGGIKAVWSDGTNQLELTAWPTPNAPPTAPPLKPQTPLDWVVKYSYPSPAATR